MVNQDLGRVAVVLRGEYDPAAEYERLDCVSFQGSSYLVRKHCTGVTPAAGEYYQLAALAGSSAAADAAALLANEAAKNADAAAGRADAAAGNAQEAADAVSGEVNQIKDDLSDNAKSDAETKRSLNALWKLNHGISYQFETDDTAAYRKTVPSGAKVASVQKTGGRTIVWNQLVSSDAAIITPASNHIIVRRIDGVWTLIASDGSEFPVTGGTDMVFDLSAMFGAGNEPSTVAEFRSMFPEDYYPYNPGALISFPVHAVVKRGKNLWGGDAVRASLEALGIDATGNDVNVPGSKVLGKVILAVQPKAGAQYTFLLTSRLSDGTGTIAVVSNFYFQYDDGTKEPIKMVRNDSMSMVKTSSNPAKTLTGIVGEYQITSKFYIDPDRTGLFEGNVNAESYLPYSEPVVYPIPEAVMVLDGYCVGSNYIDFERKQFIKQCEIVDGEVVDLAAPVVTDISDLIGNAFQEPLIVEAGGSLTFQNTNGDGYQIPVPSNVEYLISLAEVNG